MINPDFVIRVLGVVLGFPVFVWLVRAAMGRQVFTGESIFWLGAGYYILLRIVL